MWGDFYVKSGSYYVTTAWNTGFGEDPIALDGDFCSMSTSCDEPEYDCYTGWIPTPDTFGSDTPGGDGVIPEPATVALLGTALAGLVAARRRRRNAA